MLLYLLTILLLKDFTYPKYSFLYTGSGYDSSVTQLKQVSQLKKTRICSEQQKYNYDDCLVVIDSFVDGYYCSGSNINSALSKIKGSTEILYIYAYEVQQVDFNNLKEQMVVFFSNYGTSDEEQSSKKLDAQDYLKLTIQNMLNLPFNKRINNFTNIAKSKKIKDTYGNPISIVGNIKNKVSCLFMMSSNIVKIINNDLDINTFFLGDNSYFADDSLKVNTTHFIIDDISKNYINKIIDNGIIQASQFGYFDYSSGYGYGFNITYSNKDFIISSNKNNNELFTIPYEIAPIFNIITDEQKFIIQNNANLDKYNGINITVRPSVERYPILHESSFNIESIGWEKVDKSKKPYLTLSIDESIAKFEPPENFDFEYANATAYYYEPINRNDNGNNDNENNNGDGNGNGDGNNDDKSKLGLIIGVVVACVVVVAVVIIVVIIIIKKKKAQKSQSDGEAEVEEE